MYATHAEITKLFVRRFDSLVMNACVLLLVAASLVACVSAAPSNQKVTDLPGLDYAINFDMYSGYMTVDQAHNRSLFYWFVTSQNNPNTDPVLLWLNGGPGCSSLMGLFTEHGPFRPNSDGSTLSPNPYSWNQVANIIYLEAPAGVGFSFSDDENDYITDDKKTAKDNFEFLKLFFQAFPEFSQNDFYLTGESYGGHYVPELALLVAENIANGTINWPVKGVAVGNPGTTNDWYFNVDEWAFTTFMYTHGLLPQQAYENCVAQCGWDAFLKTCSYVFEHPSSDCKKATNMALRYIPTNIDYYDVFSPVCHQNNDNAMVNHAPKRLHRRDNDNQLPFEPCLSNYMTTYLNIAAVQSAIHARPTKWKSCGGVIYQNDTANIVPIWAELMNTTDWRLLVYSGDADSAVPFLGTQKWIACLERPIVQDWHNWEYNQQTAGSVIVYDRITFMTIKGAGHMVPYYLPPQAYAFYKRWLVDGDFSA